MKILLTTIFSIALVLGQTNNQSTINLQAGIPPEVNTTGVTAGVSGNGQYYYWVIATYPIGKVTPTRPGQVINVAAPSATNTFTISWSLLAGATSYDVIRTSINAFPGSCTSCLVSSGNTTGSVTDNGTLTNYSLTGVAVATNANITLNNQTYSVPTIIVDTPMVFPNPSGYVLPASTNASLGGIISPTCPAGQHWNGIVAGTVQCTPDAASYTLPDATAVSLGGVIAPTCGVGEHYSAIAGGTLTCTPDSGSGSGSLVMTTGVIDPVGVCTQPSTTNLAAYWNSVNFSLWVCDQTNHWSMLFKGASGDAVEVTGATQAALVSPGAGSVSCYFDSTFLTWNCKNENGDVFTTVKGEVRVANQFLTNIPTTGIPASAAIVSADLPATVVRTDQANSYSTGSQNFTSSTQFFPKNGTSLPGTCTVGEIYNKTDATAGQNWYFCTALNTWTQQLNSGGAGYDPTDLTKKIVRENFCASFLDRATTGLGALKWFLSAGTGTPTFVTVVPCGITASTGGGGADSGIMYLSNGGIRIIAGTTADWKMVWKLSFSTLTNSTYYAGMTGTLINGAYCPANGASSNCIAWTYGSTVNSNLRLISCDAGFSCSTATSTITPVAGTTYTLTIQSIGTTISGYVNTEAPLTITTHLPGAVSLFPGIHLAANSSDATVKSLTWYDFVFSITGL